MLLFTSYCPELSYVATSSYKGVWKMYCLDGWLEILLLKGRKREWTLANTSSLCHIHFNNFSSYVTTGLSFIHSVIGNRDVTDIPKLPLNQDKNVTGPWSYFRICYYICLSIIHLYPSVIYLFALFVLRVHVCLKF